MKKILNEQLQITNSNPLKARLYNYQSFTYPWHFHSEYEIIYIERGQGQCIIGDNIIDYSDDMLIIFGSELPHCMQSPNEYKTSYNLKVNGVIIQFEKEFMQYAFMHYMQFVNINKLLNDSARGIRFNLKNQQKIKDLIKETAMTEGIEQIISFLTLLHNLSTLSDRTYGASPNYSLIPADLKNKKIEKIIAYINKKYTENITLSHISSLAAMNPTAFCRFFKENTGKTLIQYITDMRIGYACKLLANDTFNISQISMECGFENIVHFNRCFKKNMGITASEYRKRILEI